MALRQVKILLIPEDTKQVKQFRVPTFLFTFLFLITCITTLGVVIYEYKSMKSQKSLLAQLIEEDEQQKKTFLRVAGRILDLNQQLHKVQGLVNTRKILNLKKGYGKNSVHEFKNNEINAFRGTLSIPKEFRSLVRLMHIRLNNIDVKIADLKIAGIGKLSLIENEKKKNQEDEFVFKRVSNSWNRVQIREHIKAIASELEINPRLAINVARIESGFNPNIVSPKGAIGIFQVMPKFVSQKYNVTREMLFHPQINTRVGLSILKTLLDRFNNDVDLSLAAYNAGASKVVKAGYKIPSIKETRNYVRKVKNAMEDNT